MEEKTPLAAVEEVLKESPQRGFKETLDIAFNLKDLDTSLPKNRVEDEVVLPKGRGRIVKVAVFGSPEMVTRAKTSADLTILPDQLDVLFKDKRTSRKQVDAIDFFLAEAPLMPTIGKRLGTILGPRGKMPKPIAPGSDPTALIQSLKRTVRVRNKGKRTFHVTVGTRDMPPEDLAQNIQAVLDRLTAKLERGKNNLGSVYLKSTMGKSVRLL